MIVLSAMENVGKLLMADWFGNGEIFTKTVCEHSE